MTEKQIIQQLPSGDAVMLRSRKRTWPARSKTSQRARHNRFAPGSLSIALARAYSAFHAASFSISQAITGLSITLAGLANAQTQPSPALPQGGVAVHGTAGSVYSGNTLNVTTTNGSGNRSIINWQSFNIGAGQTTNINQPNAQSSSLNRVVTNVPSQIHGSLRSNGQVILVNQNGIAVGAGGVVDTAGFTASTLNITDADYKAKRLRFEGNALAGSVLIEGEDRSDPNNIRPGAFVRSRNGDVMLFAPQVSTGKGSQVKADNGNVIVGAGQSVEVTGRGLEGVKFLIQGADNKALNLGTLQGNAVGVFAGTLRHSGVIQAQSASMEGGKVVLRAIKDVEIVRDPSLSHAPVIRADGGINAQGVAQNGGSVRIESVQGNVSVGAGSQISANAGQSALSSASLMPNQPLPVINAAGGAINIVANQGRVSLEAGSQISATGSPGGTIRIVGGQEARVGALLNVSSPSFGPVDSAGTLLLIGPGQIGGTIQVLSPNTVNLTEGAQLLASGDAGGGTILIGGDYQGANAAIVNAQDTNISQGVLLEANARVNGDGGKVIVWADNDTYFGGSIKATGGEHGGDGGFGETSGKKHLYFRGRADLSARRGRTGTLLLDPETIMIQGGAGTSDDPDGLVGANDGGNISTNYTITESLLESLSTNISLEAANYIQFQGTFGGNGLSLINGFTLSTRNAPTDTGTSSKGIYLGGWGNSTFTISAGGNVTFLAGTGWTGTVVNAPAINSFPASLLSIVSGSGNITLEAAGSMGLGSGLNLVANSGDVVIRSKLSTVALGELASAGVNINAQNINIESQANDGLISILGSAVINSTSTIGNGITLRADRLMMDTSPTLVSAAGIEVRPWTGSRTIKLSGVTDTTGSGALQISQTEFDNLSANQVIRVGDTTSFTGNIEVATDTLINVGSGEVALLSNGGDITQLFAITANVLRMEAGSIILSNSTNSFSLLAARTSTGAMNISTGSLNTFLATVDGLSGLQSAGTLSFSNTNLSPSQLYLNNGGNISAEGNISIAAFETITVNGGGYVIDSNTNNLGASGNISLGTAAVYTNQFGRNLTLDSFSSDAVGGNISFGNVTPDTPGNALNNLTVNSSGTTAGQINLPSSITVGSGGASLTGRVFLNNAAAMNATGTGAITFNGEIQGNNNLSLNSDSGAITLNAIAGNGTSIGKINIFSSSGTVNLNKNITTSAGTNVQVAAGNINVGNNAEIYAGGLLYFNAIGAPVSALTTGTGSVLNAQVGNVTLLGENNITLGGQVSGKGNFDISSSAGNVIMGSNATVNGLDTSGSAGSKSISIYGETGVTLGALAGATTLTTSYYNATVTTGSGQTIATANAGLTNFAGFHSTTLGSAGARSNIGLSTNRIELSNAGNTTIFAGTNLYLLSRVGGATLSLVNASVDTGASSTANMEVISNGILNVGSVSVLGTGTAHLDLRAANILNFTGTITGTSTSDLVLASDESFNLGSGSGAISNFAYLGLQGFSFGQKFHFVDNSSVPVAGTTQLEYFFTGNIGSSVGHVVIGRPNLTDGDISFQGSGNLAPGAGAANKYSFFSGGNISSTAVRNLQLDAAGFSATGNVALGNVGIQSVTASTGVTLAANSGGSIDLKVTDADGVTIGLVGGSLPSLAQINTITTAGGDVKLINTLGAIVSGSTAFDIYAGGGNITAKAYGNIGSAVNPLALHGSSFTLGNTGGVVTQTLIAAALTKNANATLSSSNISIGSYAATLTDIYLAAGVGTTTLKMDNNPGSGNAINLTASNAAGNIIVTQPNVDFSGSGSFTFDAFSTEFQTITNIAAGHTVHVTSGNSTIATPGGWLQGAGTLNNAGRFLGVNGTISPGLSGAIGTLTVSGNLIMTSTGVMDLQIGTNATNGDRIVVGGAFQAFGGTLRITESAPGSTAVGTAYTLGTSPNFMGTFATLDAPTGIFNRSLGSGFLTVTATSLTNNWTNSAGGFWNTGGNWSRGVSPTASHDAVIDMVGFNPIVTVASGAVANSVKIGDTLTLDASLGVMGGMQVFNGGTFNHMNGGSGIITTGNNLSIDSGGVMNWAGGTIGLATDTSQQFNNNGTVNISGPGSSLQNLYLNWNNNGIVAWTGGRRIDLISNASGVINLTNTAAGQINLSTTLAGTDDFINGGPGNIINQGTITSASSNAATTTRLNVISNAMQNTGKIISNVGTLSVGTSGTLGNDSGSYTVASGAGLSFAGSRTLNSGASISGAGQFGVSSGTLTANSGVSLGVLTTGSVSLTGGLNLFIGNAQTIADLTLSAGSNITTGDALSIGTLNAAGGKFSGTGLVTTTGNSTITGQLEREGGNWLNSGNATFNTGGLIYLNNTSTLTNDAAGSMNFLSTGSTAMYSGSGSNRFINQGTLTNGAGAVSRQVSVAFDNSGVVNVNSGRLFLDSTTAGSESGTYNVATGATLQINASRNFTSLAAGAGLFGLGFLDIQGSSTQVSLSAGVGTGLLQNGTLGVDSGRLTINTGSGFSLTNTVQLQGGTINHANNMIGAISASGNASLTSPAGGTTWTLPTLSTSTLSMGSGTTFNTSNIILANFGTVDFTGDGTLSLGNSFTNQGIVNLTGNGALAGAATFNNTSVGTVNRSSGASTFTVNSAFAQGGTLSANSGTLAFTNALTNSGLLQGTARINVGGAGLTNDSAGKIAPGGTGVVGSLTIAGNVSFIAGSKLLIDATSAVSYDKLAITGNFSSVAGATVSVAENVGFITAGDTFDVINYTGAAPAALPTLVNPTDITLTAATTAASNGALRLTATSVTNRWLDANIDNSWLTAANWSRGHVPTAGEDAIINPLSEVAAVTLSSGTQTPRSLQLTGDDSLRVSGGTLTLAQTSTVGSAASLFLSGGQIDGAGDLVIAGQFNWSGGTIGGAGDLFSSGISTITNTATLQRDWNNTGGITIAAGASNSLALQSAATLTNAGSLRINSALGGPIDLTSGTAFINTSTGVFDLNSGANSFIGTAGQFQNNGLVNVNSGTLRIASPGAIDTGIYDIDSGQELQFLGSRTLGATSNITGAGTLNFAGGTQTINSTVSGGLGIASTGRVRVTASAVNLNTNDTTIVNPFEVTGGFLQGSANITIDSTTGALNWSGGIIGGAGDLITPIGANTTITGAATIQRDWNNAATITLDASGTSQLIVQGVHILANSGTMQVNSTNATPLNITNGAVSNTGTINWNGGVSNSISGAGSFANNGQFNVIGNSTVTLQTSTGNDSGDYSIAAGSRLNFNTGVRSLLAGSDINGGGIVASTGGIVAINDPFGIASTGTLRVEGGSMALNSASPITFANPITQTGGTLTGTADITLAATSGWLASGGTFSGAGSLRSVAGSNSQISGAANLSQRNWLNEGGITLDSGGSTSLGLSGNADLTNTGTINVNSQSTGNVISLGANSDFNNSGMINWNTGKSAGFAGAGNFNNQSAGVFNISGASTAVSLSATGFVQAGTVNIGAGSSLIRSSSGNVANAGLLMGAGTLNVGSNTLTNSSGGTITPGGIGSIATLTIAGNVDISTGNLLFDLQTPAFSDRLAVTGNVVFGAAPLKLNELFGLNIGNSVSLVTFGGAASGGLPTLDTSANLDVNFSRVTTASSNGALVVTLDSAINRWKNAPTDQQWTTSSNWTRGHVPTALEAVVIDPTTSQTVTLTGATGSALSIALPGDDKLLISSQSLTLGATTSTIASGASLELSNALLTGAGSTLNLAGTLVASGTGNLSVSNFNNSGTVNLVSSGHVLQLNSFGSDNGGTYNIAAGAIVSFVGSSRSLDSATNLNGLGTMKLDGSGTLLTITGGVGGNLFANGTVDITSGELLLNGGGVARQLNRLQMANTGTLTTATSADRLIVTGSLSANGGRITGPGTLTTSGNSSVTGVLRLNAGNWVNSGSLSFSASGSFDAIEVSNNATLTNTNSGTISSNNMQDFAVFSGATLGTGGTVNNFGLIELTDATTNTRDFSVAQLNNNGTLKLIGTGRIALAQANFAQAGTLTLVGGAKLFANSMTNTGLIEGVGTLDVVSGTVTNGPGGIFAPGDVDGVAGVGTLTVMGNLDLGDSSTQRFNMALGGSDRIIVNGNLSFSGAAGPSMDISEFGGASFLGGELVTLMTATGSFTILGGQVTTGSGVVTFKGDADVFNKAYTAQAVGIENNWITLTPAGGSWYGVSNWSRGAAPNAYHDVYINQTSPNLVTINAGTAQARSITIGDGASSGNTLSVSGTGSLTVNNQFEQNLALINIWGGNTLSLTGVTLAVGDGILAVKPGGVLNLDAATVSALAVGLGDADILNEGLINNVSGTSILGKLGGSNQVLLENSALGTIAVQAGTLKVEAISFAQNGLITISSAASTLSHFSGTLQNDGTIDIAGGRLDLGTAQLSNASAGLIRGTGLITTANLVNEGIIAPGAPGSIGTLTISGDFSNDSSGILQIRADASFASDQLNVEGAANLAGTISFGSLVGHAYNSGQSYSVLTATGTTSGGFATVDGFGLLQVTSNYSSGAFFALSLVSGQIEWIGTDGDWSNSANWKDSTNTNRLPTAGDTVLINPSGAKTVTVSTGTDFTLLNFAQSDDTILINPNGTLTLLGGDTLAGTLHVNGGILTNAGVNTLSSSANRIVVDSGQFNVNANFDINFLTLNSTATNAMTISAGSTLSLLPNGNTFLNASVFGAGDIVNQSNGYLNINDINIAPGVTNAGTIDIFGSATLSSLQTSSGSALWLNGAGTLIHSAGDLTINGFLGGNGTVDVGAGNLLTVSSTGVVNPGGISTTQGKLHVVGDADFSSALLAFDLQSTSSNDHISVTGDVSLPSNIRVDENSPFVGGGQTYSLLTAGSFSGPNSSTSVTFATAGIANSDVQMQTNRPGATSLEAQTTKVLNNWISAADGSWTAAANWSRGHAPNQYEDVVIAPVGSKTISLVGTNGQALSVTMSDTDDTLVIQGNGVGTATLSVENEFQSSGTVQIIGVTTKAGSLYTGIASGDDTSIGLLRMQDNSFFIAGGDVFTQGATISAASGFAPQIQGIEWRMQSGEHLFQGTGSIDFSGTTLYNENLSTVSIASGLTVFGASVVNQGTLSIATGSTLSLASGNSFFNEKILTGSGTVKVSGGGNFENASTGIIRPGGVGIGELTLTAAGGGQIFLDEGSAEIGLASISSYDKIKINGPITTASAFSLVLNETSPFLAGAEAFEALSFSGMRSGGLPTINSSAISGKSFTLTEASSFGSALTLTASGGFVTDIFWDGGGGDGLWSNKFNWSTDLLPAANQKVTLNPVGSGSVTIASGTNISGLIGFDLDVTDALFITGGSLALPGTNLSLNGTVNLQGGSLTLPSANLTLGGTLNLAGGMLIGNALGGGFGQFNWESGIMIGSGSYLVTNFAFTGSGSRVLSMSAGGSLNANAFTTTMAGGELSLTSGTFSAGLGMVVGSAATLAFDGGSLNALSFNNNGVTEINTGNVVLPVTSTQTGIFNIANSANLEFSKDTTLAVGAGIVGGSWTVAGSKTVTALGSLQRGAAGITTITGTLNANSNFETDELILQSGGSLAGSGGMLKVNTSFDDAGASNPISGFASATIVQASGDLIFNQALSVTGNLRLSATRGEIDSDTSGVVLTSNSFQAVAFNDIDVRLQANTISAGSTAGDVFLNIAGASQIASLSTASGHVAFVVASGNVGQLAAINTAGLVELDLGASGVSWLNAANVFGEGVHVVNAGLVQLISNAASPLTVSGAAAILQLGGGDIQLGSSTSTLAVTGVGGLTVVASANITQGAALNIAGKTDLQALSGNITLPTLSTYGASVKLIAGGSVELNDQGALVLEQVSAQNAKLTAGGSITQVNSFIASNLTTLDAGLNLITLSNAGNDFKTVFIAAAGGLQMRDSQDLVINGSVATNADITFGSSISSSAFNAATLNLTASAPSGLVNMDVNVSSATSFAATTGDYSNIAYRNANKGIASMSAITASGDVVLSHGGAMPLPAIQAGSLSVTAGGPVTQLGTDLQISGDVTVNAAGQNITLTKAGNTIGNFSATGQDVTLVSNQTVNPDIDATGSVSITAPDISQSAGNAINSAAFSASVTGSLGLFGVNNLGSLTAVAGLDIDVRNDAGGLNLGQVTSLGNAVIKVGGNLSRISGTVQAAGTVILEGANIGSAAAPIVVDAPTVRARASLDAYLVNQQASILEQFSAGGMAQYSSALDIDLTGNISAASVELISGGDLGIGNALLPVLVQAGNSILLSGVDISLVGGSAAGASSSVKSAGTININATGNFVIEGGSATDTFATVEVLGAARAMVMGTLSVIGGTGQGAYAKLDPAAGSPLDVIAGSINLQGGQGAGAYAAIVSDGDITLSAASLSMQAGSGLDADAVVISNFGNVSLPASCNGCLELSIMPLGDGITGTGFYSGGKIIAQSNSTSVLTTQLIQIDTILEDLQKDPEEERDAEPDIVVEGQCP